MAPAVLLLNMVHLATAAGLAEPYVSLGFLATEFHLSKLMRVSIKDVLHFYNAMRKPGWEVLPRGDFPVNVAGWYPPVGVPATAVINLQGDARKEIAVSLNDGFMVCFSADAGMIWRYNYTNGNAIMYASEPMVADLNRDGSPEIVFCTYGAPAAPTIADLDGDGQLEIMVQTFDHGMDIFSVPGSGCDCLLWTTARGGPLRMGQPSGME